MQSKLYLHDVFENVKSREIDRRKFLCATSREFYTGQLKTKRKEQKKEKEKKKKPQAREHAYIKGTIRIAKGKKEGE